MLGPRAARTSPGTRGPGRMLGAFSRVSPLVLLGALSASPAVMVDARGAEEATRVDALEDFGGLDTRLLGEHIARSVPRGALRNALTRKLGGKKKKKRGKKKSKGRSKGESKKSTKSKNGSSDGGRSHLPGTCDPKDVVLSEYKQWEDETGYWIGRLDFYNSDGEHFSSPQWPFSYEKYRGFITGNVDGNKYRQRNVFVYRPLPSDECASANPDVLGLFDGTCGENGNTKVFFADQEATTCSSNPVQGGDIEGDYLDYFYTTTELVGRENAVLYQVFLKAEAFGPGFPAKDCVFQSQLTTITRSVDGQVFRTRTAQNFECFNPANQGQPTEVSYYRERKVDESEFYTELQSTLDEFGVTVGDTCAWMNDDFANAVPSDYVVSPGPGFEACREHLEQSFEDL